MDPAPDGSGGVRLPQPILIVSDGTGDTAEKVVRAALRQFSAHVVLVRTYSYVNSAEQLTKHFHRASRQGAFIVTTLVQKPMRDLAQSLSHQLDVPHIDLIGNLLVGLENFLHERSSGVPGLLHQADETYFRRIEAIEYTVKADDGKEPRMLKEADIVLVGVSRTSKTPLSTFLAHKGFKVGNVPIVLDGQLPPPLFDIDQQRIFGLTIAPEALVQIRRSRLKAMRMASTTNYGDLDYILAELEYADEIFRGNKDWPVVDVTNKAVEESAATIIRILRDRGLAGPMGEMGQL